MGKRLGQHFLNDRTILRRIVDAIDPRPDDIIIEVGPGQGTLTRLLAPQAGTVIAIEKDRRLAEELREQPERDNVQIVEADALSINWGELSSKHTVPRSPFPVPRFKVVGNIPYYITSPLIEKALQPPQSSLTVFLVQREVADRITAPPGSKTYGALTVGVQSVAKAEKLFVVRAGAFSPPPKVDSAVIRLTPLAQPLVTEAERAPFRVFVVALFGRRRKQIARSFADVCGLGPDSVAAILASIQVEPRSRVEVLSPSTLVQLFRAVPR